jgi:hypothetical protein
MGEQGNYEQYGQPQFPADAAAGAGVPACGDPASVGAAAPVPQWQPRYEPDRHEPRQLAQPQPPPAVQAVGKTGLLWKVRYARTPRQDEPAGASRCQGGRPWR